MAAESDDGAEAGAVGEAGEARRRRRVVRAVCVSSFCSVLQHIANLQSEPVLLQRLTGDLARTTSLLANTQVGAQRSPRPQ